MTSDKQAEWAVATAFLMAAAGVVAVAVGLIMGVTGISVDDPSSLRAKDTFDCGSAWSPNYDLEQDIAVPSDATFATICQARVDHGLDKSVALVLAGVVVGGLGAHAAIVPGQEKARRAI